MAGRHTRRQPREGSHMDITVIDAALRPLTESRQYLGDEAAKLAVRAIALLTRQALPEAAAVNLAWHTEGNQSFLAPAGWCTVAGAPVPQDGREAALGQLREALRRYCRLLDETTLTAWWPYATMNRLLIGPALGVTVPPCPPGTVTAAVIPDILDGRHATRDHPCDGTWGYAGVNRGGHELYDCDAGHRLIAAWPAAGDGHRCHSACAGADCTIPGVSR